LVEVVRVPWGLVAGDRIPAKRQVMGAVWEHADQAAGRVMNRFQHGTVDDGSADYVILDGVLAGDW